MKLINASYEILTEINSDDILKLLEKVARTCYKSEDKITPDSAKILIKSLKTKNHAAMLEFFDVIVKFTVDRGVSHEIVRHRIASYAQESTRYCNYSKEKFNHGITYIDISGVMRLEVGKILSHPTNGTTKMITEKDILKWYDLWFNAMQDADKYYAQLTDAYCPAQLARSVLPNSTKTEINAKYNLREWMHFFQLRCAPAAHPQMREVTIPLLHDFQSMIPIIFDDIKY